MAKEKKGYKLKLPSGKECVISEPRISHRNMAAQVISGKAGDDPMTYGMMLNDEMIRQVLYSIEGKVLTPQEKLDFDEILTVADHMYISSALNKISEVTKETRNPQMEVVSFGDK